MNEGISAVIEDWPDMMYAYNSKDCKIKPSSLAKLGTDLPKNKNTSSMVLAG